ncbi:CRAL-TRIO domain-containing protein [Gorgonomyces haynaldii]|nr:CRAL-TRIO domain-containing protein [Gorgonomyces haynaldii]
MELELKEDHHEHMNQLRVMVQDSLEHPYLTDDALARHLVANNYNLHKAHQSLVKTVDWRISFKTDDLTLDMLREEAVHGTVYTRGSDKHGHPIVYLKKKKTNSNPVMNLQLLVYTIERAIQQLPKDKTKCFFIFDLEHYSRSNSPPLSVTMETLQIFMHHYPERMFKTCIVHAPMVFSVLFQVVAPLLDPKTRKKIVFLKDPRDLLHDIDEKQLELKYGGQLPFDYEQYSKE